VAGRIVNRSDLRNVAREALGQHDLAVLRMTPAAQSFNGVVRVRARTGLYALRVGAPQVVHAEGTLDAEAAWLSRLRAQGWGVAVVHPDREGRLGTPVADRTCVLFDWVVGRSLRTRLSGSTAAGLGRLAARLHRDAEAWQLPRQPDVLVADRVVYWRLSRRLPDLEVADRSVFAEALDRAEAAVAELWRDPPHPPHLVHGDLSPANVLVTSAGKLVPIDFQDLVWGLEVQDLAITLAVLRRLPDGDRLAGAFRQGYAATRPWPDVPPGLWEALYAARALHQIELTVELHDPAELGEYLAGHAERLRSWLRS
jgi:Ser/Thr protein kinase RdoA (MazF antagonist)